MKKYFLLLSIILLVMPLIFAQTYQKGELIDLKIPFEVNGSAADSSATCNLSIQYPNSTYAIANKSMTNKNNGEFNYTLTNETGVLGKYNWVAFCCEGVNCAAGYGDFEITQTGKEKLNTGEGLSLFGSVLVMLVIAIFFFLISLGFQNKTGKIICIGLAGIIFFIAILYSLVILNQNFGGFSAFTEGYANFWMVIKVFGGVILTFFMLYCFLLAFKLWGIKRGLIED